MDNRSLMVSVVMLSYNHERYITEALESVLCQKTNFKYEIIIGDDASIDNTRKIIEEYHSKYPNVLKPVLRSKNLGANNNFIDILKRCTGKYLAFLEGDDSWASPRKLQMQFDFLETHPEFVGVSSWCNFIDRNGNPILYCNYNHYSIFHKHIFAAQDFYYGKVPGQGGSTLFRNIFPELDFDWAKLYSIDPLIGDQISIFLYTLNNRKIYCTFNRLTNYRYIVTGIDQNYSSTVLRKLDKDMFFYIFNYFHKFENTYYKLTGNKINFRIRKSHCIIGIISSFQRTHDKKYLKQIFSIIKAEPHPFLLLIKTFTEYIRQIHHDWHS